MDKALKYCADKSFCSLVQIVGRVVIDSHLRSDIDHGLKDAGAGGSPQILTKYAVGKCAYRPYAIDDIGINC